MRDVYDFEDDDYDDEDLYFEDDDDMFAPEDIAEMEALAADFAESYEDDEDEEDAFLGALAGLAAKALPMAMKAAPMLLSAGRSILGGLSRNKSVRSAARAVPKVLRDTARDQLNRYSRGQRVTKQSTLRSAARHTARAMRPSQQRRIVRRHRVIVRRRPTPRYPTQRYPTPPRRRPTRLRRVCQCRMVRY